MAVDDREKLVKQAISHFWYGVSHDIFSEPVTTYAKLAIEALEKEKESGVTVQAWISAKDRLPDYGQEVVVYGGKYLKSCVTTMRFWDSSYVDWFGVTHWQPLPQPPKGE